MPTLLVGYDVECAEPDGTTERFLEAAVRVHRRLGVPCTFFLTGQVAERSADAVRRVLGDPLFDFQQHTYSHLPLKTVRVRSPRYPQEKGFWEGGTLDDIRREVEQGALALERVIGVRPVGLTGPISYHRGLADRPDILGVLHSLGVRFVRTWGRDEHDFQPNPHSVQPFWYDEQGYPHILETCIHGWLDCVWLRVHGWHRRDEYLAMLKATVDGLAGTRMVWSHCQHDWSSVAGDPEMRYTLAFLEYALSKGFECLHYLAFYERERERKKGLPGDRVGV